MMLIICDKNPYKAVEYLIEHTNKNFVFKQLLELGQLICSCGFSDVYKPIKQGKELQKWIKNNPEWIFYYFGELYRWCYHNINLEIETMQHLVKIVTNLYFVCDLEVKKENNINPPIQYAIFTAIWRYSKEYSSEYPTNSELPIEVVCELYKKYITEFKFKKSEV